MFVLNFIIWKFKRCFS